jgi:hypothetical protein
MVVGICRITLIVPESHSLKERRMVLRRIKDRVRNKFNVAIAEVSEGEYKDAWQSAQIGFAVVANEKGFTQSVVQKVLDFVDSLGMAKLADDEQDYITYGEERAGEIVEHWEPDPDDDDDDHDEHDDERDKLDEE